MTRHPKKLKLVSIVGARPQFVKAAALSPAIRAAGLTEILVNTGQHYDWEMSTAFFDGLSIPRPEVSLQVGSATHGVQTGKMLAGIEEVLVREDPKLVVVYGDTNSTLAGSLAAAKLHIPVAHVEAGLRSFDRSMPEELNRVVADHLSTLLFAPTTTAIQNLQNEGIERGVVRTGDVMYDVAVAMRPKVLASSRDIMQRWDLKQREYFLVTVHRAENTDDAERWNAIVEAIQLIANEGFTVLWPAHPRTRKLVASLGKGRVRIVDPLPYLETQCVIHGARAVLTDSGGLQKEAAFHRVPCVTLRDQTEWVELTAAKVNVLAGANASRIRECALSAAWPTTGLADNVYGDGSTSTDIVAQIVRFLNE